MNEDNKNTSKQQETHPISKVRSKIAEFINILRLRRAKTGKGTALEDINKAFSHINPQKVILSLLTGILIIFALTGIYIVNPGEQAVIRRFGAVLEKSIYEGIHYRLHYPIDQVQKVNISEVRRADVGINLPEHMHTNDTPSNVQLLTGDENIIRSEAIVHYKVIDATKFLYNVNSNDEILVRNSIEAALVEVISSMPVDDILSTQKVQAQGSIMKKAQSVLDKYDAGIQLTAFNIQSIVPPDTVANAFKDVTAAKEDKEKEINQAKGYYNSLIPEARGKANDKITQAEAYKIEVINNAKGEAQKFEAMLLEYQKNSQIYSQDTTKYRLFLETLQKILPKVKKYIVDAADNSISVKLYDSKTGIKLE